MRLVRRLLPCIAGVVLCCLQPVFSSAVNYPNRPVQWIVGFAAGGSNDVVARLFAERISTSLGQQVVVVNRSGSGGMIGAEAAINSPPDGHTILFVAPNNTIGATLYKHLRFDFLRDTDPVAGLIRLTNVMVVRPSLPVHTVAEFIDYAKANPGKITFASAGVGTTGHLSSELFKSLTGIDMVHAPYRGSSGVYPDLLSDKIDMIIDNLPAALEYVRSGRLRALGVTTRTRAPALPDTPPISDTVSGFEASPWNGIVAPKGTPAEIIEIVNKAVADALEDVKMKSRIEQDFGATPMKMSPTEFGKFLDDDVKKWSKVVKSIGLSVD
jgi:tripartite-type tricarboxylate transporter receptor subunit TctC